MNNDTLHWLEESLAPKGLDHPELTVQSINPLSRDLGTLAALQPAPAPLSGGLPDFELLGVLGEGGMGQVLLARQRSLGREVAIKIVKPSRAHPSTQAALVHEARLTGALEHPSIIPLHLLSQDSEGSPLLVMKRVEGTSWKELLQNPTHPFWSKDPSERLKQNLDILMQVCNAVHFAHKQGVLHRDLKPSNVMLGNFGEVYVLDWGVALQLDPDGTCTPPSLAGTLCYIAPEMLLRGAKLDGRTDVYLLGATLYEVLTGDPPHKGGSLGDVLRSSLSKESRSYPEAHLLP